MRFCGEKVGLRRAQCAGGIGRRGGAGSGKRRGIQDFVHRRVFGPIVRDAVSRELYAGKLGIGFREEKDGYLHTEELAGAKAFALWPLAHAAQSCFGSETWPEATPAPQAWLEFDVDDVAAATAVLEAQGVRMLVRNRTEPWGQTVSRFLAPEGLLVGVTHTPAFRE
jgi:catechol 2,3-dioxygenase-like lactoylglutathione lyase family enzyme